MPSSYPERMVADPECTAKGCDYNPSQTKYKPKRLKLPQSILATVNPSRPESEPGHFAKVFILGLWKPKPTRMM